MELNLYVIERKQYIWDEDSEWVQDEDAPVFGGEDAAKKYLSDPERGVIERYSGFYGEERTYKPDWRYYRIQRYTVPVTDREEINS